MQRHEVNRNRRWRWCYGGGWVSKQQKWAKIQNKDYHPKTDIRVNVSDTTMDIRVNFVGHQRRGHESQLSFGVWKNEKRKEKTETRKKVEHKKKRHLQSIKKSATKMWKTVRNSRDSRDDGDHDEGNGGSMVTLRTCEDQWTSKLKRRLNMVHVPWRVLSFPTILLLSRVIELVARLVVRVSVRFSLTNNFHPVI